MSSDKLNSLRDNMSVYLVTDRSWLNDGETLEEVVSDAIDGGVSMVQLREKSVPYDEFVRRAKSIKKITDAKDVIFIINDNIDVALEVGADGVHLGASDTDISRARAICPRDFIIGASARTIEGAISAQEAGANYLGVGAVFGTSTKKDAKTISVDILKGIIDSVDIPVVAIGGVSKENIPRLRGTGISGVAVISAILASDDKRSATQEIFRLVEEAKNV